MRSSTRPTDGSIEVDGASRAESTRSGVTVADNGPGIADAEQAQGRSSASIAATPAAARPGVGLGLSLVEAVAKLHGSSLRFEDNNPGLRVVMVLHQDAPQTARSGRRLGRAGGC